MAEAQISKSKINQEEDHSPDGADGEVFKYLKAIGEVRSLKRKISSLEAEIKGMEGTETIKKYRGQITSEGIKIPKFKIDGKVFSEFIEKAVGKETIEKANKADEDALKELTKRRKGMSSFVNDYMKKKKLDFKNLNHQKQASKAYLDSLLRNKQAEASRMQT